MTELLRLIHGSAHDIPLPDGSVQCIVTSPPYWGLRKYTGEQSVGWPAVDYAPMPGLPPLHVDAMRCELGLEPTPEAYIGHMVLCLREWRRVLRNDGTCFVNLGDSYSGSGQGGGGSFANDKRANGWNARNEKVVPSGLKAKDLCMIPARFALAAQADGWWLRADIIGHKVAPMPESVTDRPTRSHEHIFLLTKSARYFWDADAVREELAGPLHSPGNRVDAGVVQRNDFGTDRMAAIWGNPAGRNVRDVWEWRPQPFPGAHFAVWPESIPERCILAGTSARGACPTCGAPWRRVVEREHVGDNIGKRDDNPRAGIRGSGLARPPQTVAHKEMLGWQPTCTCFGEFADSAILRPCVVLDPFHGSGTTGVVALRLGRSYVGVDISAEYLHGVTAERMGDGVQIGMAI